MDKTFGSKVNELNTEQPRTLLSAIQLSSRADVSKNLNTITKQLTSITQKNLNEQHIIVLPECCIYFGGKDSEQLSLAQQSSTNDQLSVQLAALAKKFKVFLVAGSIPILTSEGDKFTNSCCVFSPTGHKISQYDKIHLFDVEVSIVTNLGFSC